MDDPALDPADHRRALAGLARLNRVSRSAALVWGEVARVAGRLKREVRVLDVATGGGDLPIALARRAARAGLPVRFEACDLSPTAVAHAAAAAEAAGLAVRVFRHDALADPLPAGYDIVTCSLFLHHLSDADAVRLLAGMAAAGDVLVVNDLNRSRANYGLVWLAGRAVSRSAVVHTDGPRSVRAAFTPAEARGLADKAGLAGAVVAPRFPCRWLLTWEKR